MISTDSPTPCQDNPYPFDAVLEGESPREADVAFAKAICAGCHVKAACLSHGRRVKAQGVFGGRLIGLTVKGQQPKRANAPLCIQCGQERGSRDDRPGWRGARGMCDRCYQAVLRRNRGIRLAQQNNRDDVDTAKVDRAICGEEVSLNLSEREYAVELLTDRGLSAAQTAFLLRLSSRTVERIRSRIGRVAS